MQTNERDTPGVLGSNEGLGPLPEQAGWALEMHGQCVMFANNADKALGYSPGATTRIFTERQVRDCIGRLQADIAGLHAVWEATRLQRDQLLTAIKDGSPLPDWVADWLRVQA